MNLEKEKFQQQILFEESSSSSAVEKASPVEQVIMDQDNFELVSEESIEELSVDLPEEKRSSHWLFKSVLGIFTLLVGVETTLFFIEGFDNEPYISSLYGVLLLLITIAFSRTAYKEIKGLRALKQRQQFQQDINEIIEGSSDKDARKLCDKTMLMLPCDSGSAVQATWSENIAAELCNKEVLTLFEQQVLQPTDQKVLDKIGKYSSESVVLVALSPIAIVDMMLMFWRNLKMIDDISRTYGLNLSYMSRIRLIKQVFVNMVYAGATELIADVGADLIGADLLGKLSSRLAQGLGAGMLTARLGLQTMKMSRPIEFKQKEAPKLKDVRKQLVSKIAKLSKSD